MNLAYSALHMCAISICTHEFVWVACTLRHPHRTLHTKLQHHQRGSCVQPAVMVLVPWLGVLRVDVADVAEVVEAVNGIDEELAEEFRRWCKGPNAPEVPGLASQHLLEG